MAADLLPDATSETLSRYTGRESARRRSSSSAYEECERYALATARRVKQLRHVQRRERRQREAMQMEEEEPSRSWSSMEGRRQKGLHELAAVLATMETQETSLLHEISSRRGFVSQQLTKRALSPLHRWYYLLQLLLDAEARASGAEEAPARDPEPEEEDRFAVALEALNKVLAQDRACFDVRYAAGPQVQDVVNDLVDTEEEDLLGQRRQHRRRMSVAAIEELLSFSTLKAGAVCRITCIRFADGTHEFRSSAFIPDLQTTAAKALDDRGNSVGDLIKHVWDSLALEHTH